MVNQRQGHKARQQWQNGRHRKQSFPGIQRRVQGRRPKHVNGLRIIGVTGRRTDESF